MTDKEVKQAFITELNKELDKCDSANTPRICSAIQTTRGRERIVDMVLRMAGREGISIGTALANIEMELA